jgi:hypothetical protein
MSMTRIVPAFLLVLVIGAAATAAQEAVSSCRETKSPCVYYGPPALTCARSTEARESDALQIHPRKCPSLPAA